MTCRIESIRRLLHARTGTFYCFESSGSGLKDICLYCDHIIIPSRQFWVTSQNGRGEEKEKVQEEEAEERRECDVGEWLQEKVEILEGENVSEEEQETEEEKDEIRSCTRNQECTRSQTTYTRSFLKTMHNTTYYSYNY